MQESQWISLLGLAARARKLVTGEELVVKDIRKGNLNLVLLSADASELTKKKITDKCNYYSVPCRIVSDRATLGEAIGKGERVVIGVTDIGFSKKLITIIDQKV
ncbi:YlxQ family RNA-binding protein [Anaerobacillus sp. MEB173]|uniref:YlxQ family RNA-binding protein n=1 Tax=Anaerobacillus sp. MEB173 TaxID=3383345 RepID=UPI003F9094D4